MELNKEAPKLRDYKYAVAELLSSAVAGVAVKVAIGVIPVFIYLTLRQILLYLDLRYRSKITLTALYSKYQSLTKEDKKVIKYSVILRIINLILAWGAFAALPISAYKSIEMPIGLLTALLLGVMVMKERFTVKYLIAVLLIITGASLIVGLGTTPISATIVIVVFIAGLAVGGSSLCMEKMGSTLTTEEIVMLGVAAPLIPLFLTAMVLLDYNNFSWIFDINLLIIVTALFGTLTTGFNNKALAISNAKIGATRTTVLRSFNIIAVIAIAVIFLGDTVNTYQTAGIILSIIGTLVFVTAKLKSKNN